MGPYTKDMRIEDVRPPHPLSAKEEGLATKSPPPHPSITKNMDKRGWALARAWALGGGKPYRSVSRQKKHNRVAANLERTGSGTGMSIADG